MYKRASVKGDSGLAFPPFVVEERSEDLLSSRLAVHCASRTAHGSPLKNSDLRESVLSAGLFVATVLLSEGRRYTRIACVLASRFRPRGLDSRYGAVLQRALVRCRPDGQGEPAAVDVLLDGDILPEGVCAVLSGAESYRL